MRMGNLGRLMACFACLGSPAAAASGSANYDQPLDRPYTLRNPDPLALEREYGRMLRAGGPMSFIYPRPCLSETDSSRVCGAPHGLAYAGADGGKALNLSPQAGYAYRRFGDNAQAAEAGLLATGWMGPISFSLDTRMYTELHDDTGHASFDREFMEKQDESSSGALAYTSYSRFRAHMSIDLPWGRLKAGKDAVHWGPGLYNNLSFGQEAIPFRHVAYQANLGPLSVISLYGILAAGRDWETDTTRESRSLYAHRYEWRIGRDWLLGISEQLVLYGAEAPFAFLPVIPLFIAKAEEKEALNNGNLAVDVAWRFRRRLRIYSEFFLDDMQSPASLFNASWGNKWAWMAGSHWSGGVGNLEAGAALEYARLEPWVYSHYRAHTAQTAHFDFPLGNQGGPNSQTVTAKVYGARPEGGSLSLRVDLRWKGGDHGSGINDEFFTSPRAEKRFLYGVGSPEPHATLSLAYPWNRASFGAQLGIGSVITGTASVLFRY